MNHQQRRITIGWALCVGLLLALHNPTQGYKIYSTYPEKLSFLERESWGALVSPLAPLGTALWIVACASGIAAVAFWLYRVGVAGNDPRSGGDT